MIEIHTLAWKGDRALTPEDGPTAVASVFARVFVDGVEIPQVVRVRTRHQGDDFSHVVVTLLGPIEIHNHTDESWKALDD